jgi:hypothetical protein
MLVPERSMGNWRLLKSAHPRGDHPGELGARERDEVVVAEAGEDVHTLRPWGGLEQGPAR